MWPQAREPPIEVVVALLLFAWPKFPEGDKWIVTRVIEDIVGAVLTRANRTILDVFGGNRKYKIAKEV